MKKYTIDYGFGISTLYTCYESSSEVEERFNVLAGTCFGIRKSIAYVHVTRVREDDRPVEYQQFEQLDFNGDRYVWREDGARKMIFPWPDEDWDTDYCEECKRTV